MRSLAASTPNTCALSARPHLYAVACAFLLVAAACSGGNDNGNRTDVIIIDGGSADAGGVDVADPDVVDPDVVDPDVVDPDVVDPDVVDPDVVDPDVVDPDVVDPDAVDPDVVDPDVVEPAAPVAPSFLRSPARGAAGGRASGAQFTVVFALDSAAPPTSGTEYQLNPSPVRVETPQ